MTPKERAAQDWQEAKEASELQLPGESVYPYGAGVLQSKLEGAYARIDYLEAELAKSRSTVSALHAYHGDTEDMLRARGLDAYRELDGSYTVHSPRQDAPVFSGTEAEVLAWAGSVDLDEVAA